MKANDRRKEILSLLGNAQDAIPANLLSERFAVSRQVIVQDIAIMRAHGYDVISTNRGYVLGAGDKAECVVKCRHSFEEIVDEGYLIISLGGKVQDIFVNHRVYGRIAARLNLSTKTDVEELYRSLVSGASKPLMSVTDGYHYHTITAQSKQALDDIVAKLREKGYLIEI
jgi:hypothetical protein